MTPWEALSIALSDHKRYEEIVTGAHIGISGFGGAFLALVGLSFFFDEDREHLWLPFIEKPLAALARIPYAQYIATFIIVGALSFFVEHGAQKPFLIAAASGIATFFAVELLGEKMGASEDVTGKIVRTGAASFVYLEFLDASFSFDGVIGAFAITNDIIQIALGLGIGAMFVRSMTVASGSRRHAQSISLPGAGRVLRDYRSRRDYVDFDRWHRNARSDYRFGGRRFYRRRVLGFGAS